MTFRYCAGAEYLVVGPVGGALTPDLKAAQRIWPLVRDGEPMAAWLAELLGGGLALLPDFVLFEFDVSGLRAILRGPSTLTVVLADGSSETCSGLHFRTWAERVFPTATVVTSGQFTTPDMPLLVGVAAAGGFMYEPGATTASSWSPGLESVPAISRSLKIVRPEMVVPQPEPPAMAPAVVQPQASAVPEPSEVLAQTRTELDEPLFGHVFESTILRQVGMGGDGRFDTDDSMLATSDLISHVPSASSPDVSPQLGDHDGSTIMAGQLAALRQAVPALPSMQGHIALAPSVLVLTDGSRVPLDRAVILGRRPQVERVSSAELPYLITVLSPNQDISRNHLQIRPGDSTLLAADLHATNGTLLRRADGSVVEITGGAEVSVVVGDSLDLGDGVVARIEAG